MKQEGKHGGANHGTRQAWCNHRAQRSLRAGISRANRQDDALDMLEDPGADGQRVLLLRDHVRILNVRTGCFNIVVSGRGVLLRGPRNSQKRLLSRRDGGCLFVAEAVVGVRHTS